VRYNPCGRIVDIGRRPYTTVVRPWEGSQDEVTLVWYKVPWSNPVLGMPSKFQSLDQCSYPWVASGVGEVYNAPRLYNAQWSKPFADGAHVCGTPEDFAGHSIRDESLPEVVYNEADLPLCCEPAFIGSGGAVAGGTADVEVVAEVYAASYLVAVGAPAIFVSCPVVVPDQKWVGTGTFGTATLTSPLWASQGYWDVFIQTIVDGHYFELTGWDGLGLKLFTPDPMNPPYFGPTCFVQAT